MSKIRLAKIRNGQIFFEWDGPYVSKMIALERAKEKVDALRPGVYCKCKVIEGLAAGDVVDLYEPLNARHDSDHIVHLYDRKHLDMPPIRHRFRS